MTGPIFTQKGFDDLKIEKEALIAKRKETIVHLKKAREMGDLSENGYYKAAKFELGNIDRRLRQIEYFLKLGRVVQSTSTERVDIGCTIVISDGGKEYTYEIVGGYESNPQKGKISHLSPLGKALLGKRINEQVLVTTPSRNVTYTVLRIQ